ncbi:MAG: ArsC family reductase [Gammaproteobacteria bacterium]|nr:ArsC family reductase [Gammaproteobacteria bacterium]MCW8911172.1 ArsC family reductase [Gammaproteobacteria bacterium]MCW9006020.1 ArsC family reductase [Gammaproteobacteria bacterium]
MITLYGIPNCDTMKKARKWLDQNKIDYRFHDYKKLGVPEKQLKQWVKQLGWETLLNKRGTTWRKLDESVKETVNQKSAIQIMLDNPSIIKRPVLDANGKISVGFSEQDYKADLL